MRLARQLRFLLDMWIYRYLLACWCLILPLTGCAAPSESTAERGTVVGRAHVVGNEPFTRVGILTDSGTMYLLDCSKDVERVLRSNQGRFFRVHFQGIVHPPEGVTLQVQSVEILNLREQTEEKGKS